VLLRAGGLAAEEIEAALGEPVLRPVPSKGKEALPMAPGCLKKHYAPSAELRIIKRGEAAPGGTSSAYIAFSAEPDNAAAYGMVKVLSPSGDLKQAAANLFYVLHELENSEIDRIYAEEVPPQGLGLAIMDRLRRGAAK